MAAPKTPRHDSATAASINNPPQPRVRTEYPTTPPRTASRAEVQQFFVNSFMFNSDRVTESETVEWAREINVDGEGLYRVKYEIFDEAWEFHGALIYYAIAHAKSDPLYVIEGWYRSACGMSRKAADWLAGGGNPSLGKNPTLPLEPYPAGFRDRGNLNESSNGKTLSTGSTSATKARQTTSDVHLDNISETNGGLRGRRCSFSNVND